MMLRVFIFCLCLMHTLSYATHFVPGTEDIPLMEELTPCGNEVQGLFSTPEGRIVSLVVSGKTSWSYVSNFYEQSLKNLGWEKVQVCSSHNILEFKRHLEKLTLTEIKNRNGILFLRVDYVEN